MVGCVSIAARTLTVIEMINVSLFGAMPIISVDMSLDGCR